LKNFTFASGFDDKLIKNFNITAQSLTFIRLKLNCIYNQSQQPKKVIRNVFFISKKVKHETQMLLSKTKEEKSKYNTLLEQVFRDYIFG
jgi:hypothetical protein